MGVKAVYRAFYGLTANPFAKDMPVNRLYISHGYKAFTGCMEYFKTVKGFAVAYGRPGWAKPPASGLLWHP